jgi:hypothetical protein
MSEWQVEETREEKTGTRRRELGVVGVTAADEKLF